MPGSASERRDSARTAVVWEALGTILGEPGPMPGLITLPASTCRYGIVHGS